MKETVIGIDPGMMTGWAVLGSKVDCGTFDLKAHQSSPLWNLGTELQKLISQLKPELLVYEEPVARGMAARSLNRQIGVVIYICEYNLLPHYPVNPGTLKKYATGTGRADKADMARHALARGWSIADHNAVDALWLADYGRHVILPTMDETP